MTLMRNQELAKSASGLERLVGSLLVFDNIIDMHNRIGSRVCICIHICTYPFINLEIHYQMEFRNAIFLTCTETLLHNSTQ